MQKTIHPEPRFLLKGIDSLYVGYSPNFACSELRFEDLEREKALLLDDPSRRRRLIKLGGLTLAMSPSGAYPYRYVLRNRDLTMKLAPKMYPGCYVEFSSEALWREGVEALHQQITRWIMLINASQTRQATISRIDISFDYHWPNADLQQDHFTSRAKKDSLWRKDNKAETFSFGTSDIVVRIYNKSAEIAQQSQKTWFYGLWGVKDHVWRIEFQLRKNILKDSGIQTMSQIKGPLRALILKIAENHTTLRIPNGDTNRSRWPLHPLWIDLLKQIENMDSSLGQRPFNGASALEYRRDKSLSSIAGNLKALAAIESMLTNGCKPLSIEKTLELLHIYAEAEIHPVEWETGVQDRIEKYEVGQW